ncbi:mannitol dehydrogenase family protein [Frigidibacter sp. MR17.14]|uniref:mannitol dehydrogenase family protein n=1 Tax=Frigidibacter sp. MR17.14 TaxID=3126509 RepID=UPI003012D92A
MSDVTPILQFGTSRFLQAHADLFFAEAGTPVAVTVVQSSGDAARAGRLGALAAPDGYPVRIRGIENGRTLDEERRVTSVKRTLSTATDWDALCALAASEVTAILSNTGDRGYLPMPADTAPAFDQAMSYPAKLFHLLAHRQAAGGAPLTIYPMELVPENGRVLKARVLDIAAANGAPAALTDWLSACVWVNSLVDRIVSAPIEPAGAVAEPYALWAVEAGPGVTLPCVHPAVQLVPDLEEIERLKLHILNLGHTALADLWAAEGADPDRFVRQMMTGPARETLDAIYAEEVLPGFAAKGYGDEARAYLATTLERFENPFLDHRVADIAQNHPQKVERRIKAFTDWVGTAGPAVPRLQAIIERATS